MSLATGNAERAKFGYLLELAQDQVTALETDDLYGFDRILAAKRAIIETMHDTRRLMAADPTLEGVISRIQDADKMAQKLLYRKVGRIMREMDTLNRQQKARSAYGAEPSAAKRAIGFLPDTPTYMDATS